MRSIFTVQVLLPSMPDIGLSMLIADICNSPDANILHTTYQPFSELPTHLFLEMTLTKLKIS
jgi:hypothetical protein